MIKRERLIEIMNDQYDGDSETFNAEAAADLILDEIEKSAPIAAPGRDDGARTIRLHMPSSRCSGIYMASKTVHAPRWRHLRAEGIPIISTWIDEAGKGETACFADLWSRCIDEAATASAVIVYMEPGEVLKGAFVEVGAALSCGVRVYAVGCDEFSFTNHIGVTRCGSLDEALSHASLPAPAGDVPSKAQTREGLWEKTGRGRGGVGWAEMDWHRPSDGTHKSFPVGFDPNTGHQTNISIKTGETQTKLST